MSNSLLPYGLQPDRFAVHGILQARILEWVAVPFSRESYQPRDQTHIFYISCIGGWVLHHLDYQGSPYRAPSLWYSVIAAQTGQDTLYIALFHEHRINHFPHILNRLSLNHPLPIFSPLISKIRGKKTHLGNVCMDQVHIYIYFICKHHITHTHTHTHTHKYIYIYTHIYIYILIILKHNISIAI